MRIAPWLVLLALAACGKGTKDGASCKDVGTRFLEVAQRQLADAAGDVDVETRAAVDSHLPAMRDAIVRACEDHEWPAQTRGCYASAAAGGDMEACYQAMPPELRARLDEATAGKKKP
jgi:hypothetical protein